MRTRTSGDMGALQHVNTVVLILKHVCCCCMLHVFVTLLSLFFFVVFRCTTASNGISCFQVVSIVS